MVFVAVAFAVLCGVLAVLLVVKSGQWRAVFRGMDVSLQTERSNNEMLRHQLKVQGERFAADLEQAEREYEARGKELGAALKSVNELESSRDEWVQSAAKWELAATKWELAAAELRDQRDAIRRERDKWAEDFAKAEARAEAAEVKLRDVAALVGSGDAKG